MAFVGGFYRATRMHSADYACGLCGLYRPPGSPTILVFYTKRDGNILTGTSLTGGGRRMQGGMKKSRFSTNISLYLGTDAK